jgi:hypothetical protein
VNKKLKETIAENKATKTGKLVEPQKQGLKNSNQNDINTDGASSEEDDGFRRYNQLAKYEMSIKNSDVEEGTLNTDEQDSFEFDV